MNAVHSGARRASRKVRSTAAPVLAAGLLLSSACAVWFPPAKAAEPLDAGTIADQLGFKESDAEAFFAGEVVSSEIEETTEKQLALAIAMLLKAHPDDVVAAILDETSLAETPGVKDGAGLDPANPHAGAFAGVVLGPDESGEIAALLNAEPGSDLNLSTTEIARFQEIAASLGSSDPSNPAVVEAVTAAYREMLADRFRAYITNGVAGIAPYDRGGGEQSSAAEDLVAATDAPTVQVIAQAFPDLFRAFVNFPKDPMDGAKHSFVWLKLDAGDRPVFVLDHLMVEERPEGVIFLERAFYVGHSFNASQISAAAIPIEEGLVILYANQTSSDQLAGFMSTVRHSIGRSMMKDALTETFGNFRKKVE